MDTPDEMAARHRRTLAELSELGMGLARKVHARAMAAEEEVEADRLALAFDRLARAVRQAVALEARLERTCRYDPPVREPMPELHWTRTDLTQPIRDVNAIRLRQAEIREAVMEAIEADQEGMDAEMLSDFLDSCLDAGAQTDAFLEEPLEFQIARLCDAFRIPPPDIHSSA